MLLVGSRASMKVADQRRIGHVEVCPYSVLAKYAGLLFWHIRSHAQQELCFSRVQRVLVVAASGITTEYMGLS